jgi:hypothetical protein
MNVDAGEEEGDVGVAVGVAVGDFVIVRTNIYSYRDDVINTAGV